MSGKITHIDYGKGIASLAADPEVDPQKLVERLLETFRSPNYQPPTLPAAALELIALSRNSDVSYEKILSLLEKDPLIAARVLKTAQSAAYAVRGPIYSLQQALVMLGLSTLTDIFLEVSFNIRMFRAPGFEEPMNRARRHSTAVAHVARIVCRYTSISDEYAFLCGLLHEMGIVAAMITLTDVPRGAKLPKLEVVWPGVIACHEQAAAVLCRLWKLPGDVELALGAHHKIMMEGRAHPLAAAISVADSVATQLGVSVPGEADPEPSAYALEALGLTPKTLALIVAEATAICERVE